MNVGELRAILDNEFIPDALVPQNYDDLMIQDVNLTIDKEGIVTDIRFSMVEAE